MHQRSSVEVDSALGANRPMSHAGHVGPNAIIQLRKVLIAEVGSEHAAALFRRAALPHWAGADPAQMVAEVDVAMLFAQTGRDLGAARAPVVMRVAGDLTGRYILENRIPRVARLVLRALPARVSAPLLLKAIGAHAWTFAGSGQVTLNMGTEIALTIHNNLLATPGCPWHLGVLQTLFRSLVSRHAHAQHQTCCAWGDAACRTVITL